MIIFYSDHLKCLVHVVLKAQVQTSLLTLEIMVGKTQQPLNGPRGGCLHWCFESQKSTLDLLSQHGHKSPLSAQEEKKIFTYWETLLMKIMYLKALQQLLNGPYM